MYIKNIFGVYGIFWLPCCTYSCKRDRQSSVNMSEKPKIRYPPPNPPPTITITCIRAVAPLGRSPARRIARRRRRDAERTAGSGSGTPTGPSHARRSAVKRVSPADRKSSNRGKVTKVAKLRYAFPVARRVRISGCLVGFSGIPESKTQVKRKSFDKSQRNIPTDFWSRNICCFNDLFIYLV